MSQLDIILGTMFSGKTTYLLSDHKSILKYNKILKDI